GRAAAAAPLPEPGGRAARRSGRGLRPREPGGGRRLVLAGERARDLHDRAAGPRGAADPGHRAARPGGRRPSADPDRRRRTAMAAAAGTSEASPAANLPSGATLAAGGGDPEHARIV